MNHIRKSKLILTLIYRISFKVTVIISLFFILSVVLFCFINDKIPNNEIRFPKNTAYVEIKKSQANNILEEDAQEKIEYYFTIPFLEHSSVDYPYENSFSLPLESINYMEGAEEVAINNEKALSKGIRIKYFPISYLAIPPELIEEGLNIPIESLYIEKIKEGSYPKNNNEILIGETLANYYLEKFELNSYSDLIGKEIPIKTKDCFDSCINKDYQISGVYEITDNMSDKELEKERVFITPDENSYYNLALDNSKTLGVFLIFQSQKEMKKLIENYDYSWITYNSFNIHNYKLIFNIAIIVFLNITLFLLLIREYRKIFNIFSTYNISNITYILMFSSPFLFLNIIFLIIFYFNII